MEALAIGAAFRASLVEFARTARLGGPWRPYPAVCEQDVQLTCSEQNVHAQACEVFDKGVGRRFDLELG